MSAKPADVAVIDPAAPVAVPGPASADSAPQPLSLRRNVSWTFAGNVVYAGCQWGMLVVLAKLGTPEMVGRFALGLAVTAPIMMFARLALRIVQATDTNRQYRFGDYLALRLVTTALALMVVVAIAFAGGYRLEAALVILGVGAAKAFEAVSDIIYGLLQQHERMDRVSRSQTVKGPLSLAALAVTIYLSGSIVLGVAALAAVWALHLFAYDFPVGRWVLNSEQGKDLSPRWDVSAMSKLARLSLPLGFVTMLASLNLNIPRYYIEHYLGERELGIFAAMAYLILAGNTAIEALGQSASPRLARYVAEGRGDLFLRLLSKLIGIGVLIGAGGIVMAAGFGREILAVLYRPEYSEHAEVFVILMAAFLFSLVYAFIGHALMACRYFRVQLPLLGIVVLSTALICHWLIPLYGLKGAAWAILASSVLQAAIGAGVQAAVFRGIFKVA